MPVQSIRDIQLFYLFLLVSVITIGTGLALFIARKGRQQFPENGQTLLFITLIVISYGLPPLGRLLSFIFPASFENLELMSSLYKIISLFNNLFILLTIRSIQQARKRFPDVGMLPLIIGFVSVNMLLLILDKFVLKGVPVGRSIIVILDTIISLGCLFLFLEGLRSLYKRSLLPSGPWKQLFSNNILVLMALLVFSAWLFFAKTFSGFSGPSPSWLLVIYSLYLLTSTVLVITLLTLAQALANGQLRSVKPERISGGLSYTFDQEQEVAVSEEAGSSLASTTTPAHLHLSFDTTQHVYQLSVQLTPGERTYRWEGDNCVYPFFYWLYLLVGKQLDVPVEIKNAQVMRNKMVQILSKDLRPNQWVHLQGERATLSLSSTQITVDMSLFEQAAIKNKFRQHIEPFLTLVTYDAAKYEQNRMYNEFVFLEAYEAMIKKLAKKQTNSNN